eukprot:CAMPEP_0184479386 /NCGR_PEP_ID=MMETSP0113_2-20130426/1132_1 /TAXON_ID=91329 /ORGANISM="Norrisiella sphaerica, Strain BC52" /LENGTH=365 /DNA_ID=CAMNT_0026857459 /DNA_START=260 /DNA_END=1357 /DNA_ORIENTATION=+
MHIPGHLRRRFFPEKDKSSMIFFLLPLTGQRFIVGSSLLFLLILILCATSFLLLRYNEGDHAGLQQIAVAIIACDLFSVCLVWDGVYAEVQSRLNVSGMFAVVMLILAVAGMMESTIKWRGDVPDSPLEHYIYLGSMLGCGLKAIVHLFLVINCMFLPSLGYGDIENRRSVVHGPTGRALLSRTNSSPTKLSMRSKYQTFISAVNLDLGLCVVLGLLCWDYQRPRLDLEDIAQTALDVVDWLLIFAFPIWSIVLWLAVVNENRMPAVAMCYAGTILLFSFILGKVYQLWQTTEADSSNRAHQNIIILCCVLAFCGRLYLWKTIQAISKFLGSGKFKQQVNRIRYYTMEKRRTVQPGVTQYGTLCS